MKANLLASVLVFTMMHASSSDSSEFSLHRLEISDLLPQSMPGDMHLDQRGFLWLAVGKNLYRYDGYNLSTVFEVTDAPNPGALQLHQSRIAEDPNGSLWIVDGSGSLRRYDPGEKDFHYEERLESLRINDGTISFILHDRYHTLWFVLNNGDLGFIDSKRESQAEIITASKYIASTDNWMSIDESGNGKAWLLSRNGALVQCATESGRCSFIDLSLVLKKEGVGDASFSQLVTSGEGSLLFSTKANGAYQLNLENMRAKRVSPKKSLSDDHTSKIWSISASSEGEFWLSTLGGLFGSDSSGGLVPYTSNKSAGRDLIVLRFEKARRGEILAQTVGELYLLRQSDFESFTSNDNLVSPIVTAFAQTDDNKIFIGSIHGISRFDPERKLIHPIGEIFPGIDLIDSRVMTLLAHDDRLWFGGHAGGLRHLNIESGAVESAMPHDERLSAISQLAKVENSQLILGTRDAGLYVVNPTGGRVNELQYSAAGSGPYGKLLTCLMALSSGTVYACSQDGIHEYSLDGRSGALKAHPINNYLAGEEVYDILEASDGSIWAGTFQSGLYFSKDEASLHQFGFQKVETSPALPDQTVYAIEQDDLGLLWLSTNRGLARLNPSTLSIDLYNQADGLVNDEFNVGASFKDFDGYLYFGGIAGFNRFDPRKFVKRRFTPPLRVTEIMIHRKPVPYDPAYVDIPELVLTHNDHSLDVEFSTMDIISPGRSRYKYRLENFDDDWVDIGTRNSATFTSLPAGEYVLRVIGADSKGVWNYDGIVLPVRVLPAPWFTWWAFTVYALALLGFVALAKRSYDTYLQKVAATREAEQMKVTATLAMDDLQDQLEVENRLVDNLRKHASNAFDMVDEFLTMELEEVYGDDVEEPLGRARQRLHCLKALEASVYFQGDQIKVNFRDAIDRSFAEVIKANPHPVAELVLANDCSEELVPIDVAAPLLLLAHELMLNSVVHAFPECIGVECIEVRFQARAGGYQFELMDSGCGLPTAIDPSRPATMGMELIARIAERLGADLEVNREQGTHYRVTIPVETG